jgi:hypothetical protein
MIIHPDDPRLQQSAITDGVAMLEMSGSPDPVVADDAVLPKVSAQVCSQILGDANTRVTVGEEAEPD